MMVVTTVNGEDDVPVCLDACSDTWEEEFFDNLDQEDQGKEQDEEAILSLEDIQFFLESRGRLQDAMQVGNFMDNLSAVQIATANRPLFMISNSSLFRVSFNFVNTCYFFVICSFSPKHLKNTITKRTSEMGPTSQQGPNIPSPMRSLLRGFTVHRHNQSSDSRNSVSVRSLAQTVPTQYSQLDDVAELTDHSAGSYKPQTLYIYIYFLWSKVHST